MKRYGFALIVLLAVLLLAACGQPAIQAPTEEATETSEPEAAASGDLIPVTVMLDWVPNTNHIGLFVAEANGYFADQGLDVEIIQPADTPVEQVVASGAAGFGVSYQEQVTFSRTAGVPIVSVAAIIQHNTSGFAALAEKGIETPADLAGLRYGAFGSPIEDATLELLLSCFDADASTIDMINVGYDLMPLLERGEVDFAWIFYAWDGLRAEQQGIDLDILMLADYADCVPDYYTPVLIAGEQLLQENPDLARRSWRRCRGDTPSQRKTPRRRRTSWSPLRPNWKPKPIWCGPVWNGWGRAFRMMRRVGASNRLMCGGVMPIFWRTAACCRASSTRRRPSPMPICRNSD